MSFSRSINKGEVLSELCHTYNYYAKYNGTIIYYNDLHYQQH